MPQQPSYHLAQLFTWEALSMEVPNHHVAQQSHVWIFLPPSPLTRIQYDPQYLLHFLGLPVQVPGLLREKNKIGTERRREKEKQDYMRLWKVTYLKSLGRQWETRGKTESQRMRISEVLLWVMNWILQQSLKDTSKELLIGHHFSCFFLLIWFYKETGTWGTTSYIWLQMNETLVSSDSTCDLLCWTYLDLVIQRNFISFSSLSRGCCLHYHHKYFLKGFEWKFRNSL